MRGENHPKWNGGSSERTHATRVVIRKIVKLRGKCERCGSTENLQGHHKEPYSRVADRRADPENVEVLCVNCHALEHPELVNFILKRNKHGKELDRRGSET